MVDAAKLRSHEQIQEPLLKQLVEQIRADGYVRRPVLVESRHYVILDGHHRFEALKILGCKRIPVYLVNYEDKSIGLTTWPGAIVDTVTKEEVVARGLRGDPFPPKTTRHLVPEMQELRVPLDELR